LGGSRFGDSTSGRWHWNNPVPNAATTYMPNHLEVVLATLSLILDGRNLQQQGVHIMRNKLEMMCKCLCGLFSFSDQVHTELRSHGNQSCHEVQHGSWRIKNITKSETRHNRACSFMICGAQLLSRIKHLAIVRNRQSLPTVFMTNLNEKNK